MGQKSKISCLPASLAGAGASPVETTPVTSASELLFEPNHEAQAYICWECDLYLPDASEGGAEAAWKVPPKCGMDLMQKEQGH